MSAARLHRVAVLVLEGAKPLDVGIPAQVFTTRARMPYEVRVCGAAPGLVTGGDGLSYHVAHGLGALVWADIVFIPGYRFPDRDDPPPAITEARSPPTRGVRGWPPFRRVRSRSPPPGCSTGNGPPLIGITRGRSPPSIRS